VSVAVAGFDQLFAASPSLPLPGNSAVPQTPQHGGVAANAMTSQAGAMNAMSNGVTAAAGAEEQTLTVSGSSAASDGSSAAACTEKNQMYDDPSLFFTDLNFLPDFDLWRI